MSMINQPIPEFKTTAFHDDEFKDISNQTISGNWAIFLFYPRDFTFICPTELQDMAQFYDEFKELGVEIYAVSTDSHHVHKAWHESSKAVGQTRFPMLGDPTGVITRGFDVMIEETGEAHRATFLIDPEGKVKVTEIHADNFGRSAKDFLRKVKAAQYVAASDGEVCPAAWEPGDKTLKPGIDLVGKI